MNSILDEFFEGDLASQVLSDLEEQGPRRVHLHGSAGSASVTGARLAGLGAPGALPAPTPKLAALHASQLKFLNEYAAAGKAKRQEWAFTRQPMLYSIVYAAYRPAPAYRVGHSLAATALNQRVRPGGPTWRQALADDGLDRLRFGACHCLRLDSAGGAPAGSGFVETSGLVLTARHVVESPGWLFGNPPSPSLQPARLQYTQIHAQDLRPDEVQSNECLFLADTRLDVAALRQPTSWPQHLDRLNSDLDRPLGLDLQATPLSASDLSARLVAVIGHPLAGNAGEATGEIQSVFSDAPLGTKRLMPGTLDSQNPLVQENGQDYLNHNCSTLGGASGACLIDVQSAKVLGIHLSGDPFLGNRAVPAWSVAPQLAKLGVLT